MSITATERPQIHSEKNAAQSEQREGLGLSRSHTACSLIKKLGRRGQADLLLPGGGDGHQIKPITGGVNLPSNAGAFQASQP